MPPEEFKKMNLGFDEHTIELGVIVQSSQGFNYTATLEGKFIGCSSGLAYKNGDQF